MLRFLCFSVWLLVSFAEAKRPNVLFIAIDDQNDWLGCMKGHPQVLTPHLDALAARGTLFSNAHCQAPLCNPSRTSLLFGLRPSSTGVYGLAPSPREAELTKDKVSLPQSFNAAHYFTASSGKIFHDSKLTRSSSEFTHTAKPPGKAKQMPEQRIAPLPKPLQLRAMDWGAFPAEDNQTPDWQTAQSTIDFLQQVPAEQPFFIACGFVLPHVPCFAPQPWFDLYPEEQVILPEVRADDRADLPRFADYLHWRLPEPRLSTLQQLNQWKPLVRAYLASTSFMDAQVGRVLEALKSSGREQDTIVVVWSDHGWHLGEKGITGKNTLWERSTRVPLIFAGPGIPSGANCKRPVELLDLYPTLLELCGLPKREELEGHSLMPQLKDAQAARAWPAITTHNQGNHSIRTETHRYIHYADGSEELYDCERDPHEWNNLAKDAAQQTLLQQLRQHLPTKDLPATAGSAHRVLTYDRQSKEVHWEGKLIPADATLPEY
jgi:arylsulfatase A-like enzyme